MTNNINKARFLPALLLVFISIATVAANVLTPALPAIESAYSLGFGQVEYLVSLFLFGYVAGQLIYGPLAKQYGSKGALLLGMAGYVIGSIICIVSSSHDNYKLLLVGRALSGLGSAAGLTCSFALIKDLLEDSTAKTTLSFSVVSFTCAMGISVLIGGYLTDYLSWKSIFYFTLAHGIIMSCLTFTLPTKQVIKTKVSVKDILVKYRLAFGNKCLLLFSFTMGLTTTIAYGYSATAPAYSIQVLGLSASEYSSFNMINMIGMIGSSFLGSYLLKKFEVHKVINIILYIFPCSILILWLLITKNITNPWLFFTATSCMFLLSGSIFGPASFLAMEQLEDKSSASSIMSFLNMASATLGVIIIGYMPIESFWAFLTLTSCYFVFLLYMNTRHKFKE